MPSKKPKLVKQKGKSTPKQEKPSRSEKANSSRFQLAAQSYYLASIIDPFNFPGSKVPDGITVPSATSQCTQRLQTTVNAQGVTGILVKFGNLSNTGIATTATTATTTALTWNASVAKSYATSLQGVIQQQRLVSAYVSYEYQGAPLNRKGRGVLNFVPYALAGGSQPTNASTVLTQPYSEDTNVAKKPFGMVRYIPQDSNSLVYTTAISSVTFGEGQIILDGATPNDVVEFTIVENYEFIPVANTLNLITPTPSISDPIELSIASNAITTNPSFPIVQPSRDPAEGASPGVMRVHAPESTHHTGSEPTMVEKILDGIGKALPVAKDVVGTGISIAGMLAPFFL